MSKIERADIELQLKQLTDYVRDCDRRVALGEVMDLQGLDRNVMVICDRVALLPPGEAKIIESKLAAMIGELEHLAETLRKQQATLDQNEKTGVR
jgi:hypothetical protein